MADTVSCKKIKVLNVTYLYLCVRVKYVESVNISNNFRCEFNVVISRDSFCPLVLFVFGGMYVISNVYVYCV